MKRRNNRFKTKVTLFVYNREKNGRRICYRCAKSKLLKEFGKDGHGGRRGVCYLCMRSYRSAHDKAKRLEPLDLKKISKTQVCKGCRKELPIECFGKRSELDKKYDSRCIWCGQRKWSLDCYHRHQLEYNNKARMWSAFNPEKKRASNKYSFERSNHLIRKERKAISMRRRELLSNNSRNSSIESHSKQFNSGATGILAHVSTWPTRTGICKGRIR